MHAAFILRDAKVFKICHVAGLRVGAEHARRAVTTRRAGDRRDRHQPPAAPDEQRTGTVAVIAPDLRDRLDPTVAYDPSGNSATSSGVRVLTGIGNKFFGTATTTAARRGSPLAVSKRASSSAFYSSTRKTTSSP